MKLYVILPSYNIEVEKDVINTEIIDGYKLITNKTFFDVYEKEIIVPNRALSDIYLSLKKDILEQQQGEIIPRSIAKYLLIKEMEVEDGTNFDINVLIKEEKAKLNYFVLIFRLIQKGRCQFNNLYIFTKDSHARSLISFSTNIDDIGSILASKEEVLHERQYIVSIETIKNLNQASLIIRPFSMDILIPINYFMQYYNSVSMYDRIIKLAIVLESSVLAGIKEELNYRLKIRTSAFLKKDCQKILNMFYQLRSCIVHNGSIDIKYFKEIKKIINIEQCSDSKSLFAFISDYVEPLVRDILYKSFEVFAKDETIKNYNQLFSSVDAEIMKKVTI